MGREEEDAFAQLMEMRHILSQKQDESVTENENV